MKEHCPLASLPPKERREFCRRVLDSLSDLIEGEAADDLAARVDAVMGDDAGYRALCETLTDTVGLARQCGERAETAVDEQSFRDCVERVRLRLLQQENA